MVRRELPIQQSLPSEDSTLSKIKKIHGTRRIKVLNRQEIQEKIRGTRKSKNQILKNRANLAKAKGSFIRKKYFIEFTEEEDEIWSFWKSQEHLKKHRSSNSKLGKEFKESCHRLLYGRFFFKKPFIESSLWCKKFSIQEIKTAITKFNSLLDSDHYLTPPTRKAIKSTSITSFFYRTHFVPSKNYDGYLKILSPLLYYVENDPQDSTIKLNSSIPKWLYRKVVSKFINYGVDIKKGGNLRNITLCLNRVYMKIPNQKDSNQKIDLIEDALPSLIFDSLQEGFKKIDTCALPSPLFTDTILPRHMNKKGYLSDKDYQSWKN